MLTQSYTEFTEITRDHLDELIENQQLKPSKFVVSLLNNQFKHDLTFDLQQDEKAGKYYLFLPLDHEDGGWDYDALYVPVNLNKDDFQYDEEGNLIAVA